MPPTTYQRDLVSPRRRDLLRRVGGAAGAVALLGGCSDTSRPEADRPRRSARAEDRLRARAHRDSTALLARYQATATAHPALAERLRPLHEETARHVKAFAPPAGTGAASGSPSGHPSPTAPSHRGDRTPDVPEDQKDALAVLAQAERRTADARSRALVDASGELARLLASVAACGAAHAYLLTGNGR